MFLTSCSLFVPVNNQSLFFVSFCFVVLVLTDLTLEAPFLKQLFLKRGILLCKFKANLCVLLCPFASWRESVGQRRRLRFAHLPPLPRSPPPALSPFSLLLNHLPACSFSLLSARAWCVYIHCVNTVYV